MCGRGGSKWTKGDGLVNLTKGKGVTIVVLKSPIRAFIYRRIQELIGISFNSLRLKPLVSIGSLSGNV